MTMVGRQRWRKENEQTVFIPLAVKSNENALKLICQFEDETLQ